MGRYCADCEEYCDRSDFTANQWSKGAGVSRCYDCVGNWVECDYCNDVLPNEYEKSCHTNMNHPKCRKCDRRFVDANALRQHSKVHLPKTIPCPTCGGKKFARGADAVAHIESGYCPACTGKRNARNSIYDFVNNNAGQLLVPRIGYGGGRENDSPPKYPYKCRLCNKLFRNLSSLMNHEDDAHSMGGASFRQIGW